MLLFTNRADSVHNVATFRTTAERLRARDRTPLIGRSDVALTVRMKLDNTHWLPSDRACPLVNPPLKHVI